MGKPSSQVMFGATLIIAIAIVSWALLRPVGPRGGERIGFQDADAPLGMPIEGELDHRFYLLPAWTMAEIPIATRFESPMGSAHGALTYNAQSFMEMNDGRGGKHLGDDLNGIGGMNSDLGDPIFAIADGLVVYAGEPSDGWGGVLVVAHRAQEGTIIQSMYAHLDRIDVSLGQLVARGEMIGTNGTGNDHYPAHLHFEMRESWNVDIGGGYSDVPLNRIDPIQTIEKLRNSKTDELSTSPLAQILAANEGSWMEMKIEGADQLFNRLDGNSD